jgi:hypothetical protein
MIIIVHQDIGVDLDPESFRELRKTPEETPPVIIGTEDPLALMTAIEDIMPGFRNL